MRGLNTGHPSVFAINMKRLAKLICELVPSIEKVRMVNSGTEAVMSAIRLARGFTGRNRIIKFDGCYHGHSDCLLVKAGSGAGETVSVSSRGVPPSTAEYTYSVPYNDREALEKIIKENYMANRLRHNRACRREHGPCPAGRRVP